MDLTDQNATQPPLRGRTHSVEVEPESAESSTNPRKNNRNHSGKLELNNQQLTGALQFLGILFLVLLCFVWLHSICG